MLNIKNPVILLFCILPVVLSCSFKKAIKFIDRPIPQNSSIAVIIDSPNKLKNVVLARFMAKGFTVKAINAADFYSLNDIFDIKDFKKVSYIGRDDKFLSLEKSYNNLFKLHYYNFEANKAEVLADIRNKWNVQYLILLELKDWQGTSWGRAIDLRTNDLIWIENYQTSFGDSIESIIDHFINSMTTR